jgi:hypothetical protein
MQTAPQVRAGEVEARAKASASRKRHFVRYIAEFYRASLVPGTKVLIAGCHDPLIFETLDQVSGTALVDAGVRFELPEPHRSRWSISRESLRSFRSSERFDYVVLDDYLTYEDSLHAILPQLTDLLQVDGKVIITSVNPFMLWRFRVARWLGLSTPETERNLLTLGDHANLARLFGYEIIDDGYRFLFPYRMLGIGDVLNALVPRFIGLRQFCFGQFVVLRPQQPFSHQVPLSCSVVVPCYNEEANVRECVTRIPDFGSWREIIVVNDGSRDATEAAVRDLMAGRSDVRLITYEKNRGKGYAVNEGWKAARGDVLMMLDCDATTPPEELTIFHAVMERGAEFINGTRIVYPRERHSIPPLNRVGVSFFANLLSWIMQRRITDPFCGTKVFLRKHRQHFEIRELLWGDWDLFFTAAKLRLKMVELPVHYKARKAGVSKMRPLRHGLKLLQAAMAGLRSIK